MKFQRQKPSQTCRTKEKTRQRPDSKEVERGVKRRKKKVLCSVPVASLIVRTPGTKSDTARIQDPMRRAEQVLDKQKLSCYRPYCRPLLWLLKIARFIGGEDLGLRLTLMCCQRFFRRETVRRQPMAADPLLGAAVCETRSSTARFCQHGRWDEMPKQFSTRPGNQKGILLIGNLHDPERPSCQDSET